jgi:hypothetical protein
MKRAMKWVVIALLLAAATFAVLLWQQGPTYKGPPSGPADVPPPPVAAIEPEIRYPLPEAKDEPLPTLEKSDVPILAALGDLIGKAAVKQFIQPQEIVRRIVVTVDNIPRSVISAQLMPTTPVQGKFRTTGKGDNLTMSALNTERYTPFVRLLETVDAKKLTDVYIHYYPLFQKAYRDLGYPKGYFNDRLVAVIDHVLEAPQSDGPIALEQPHVFYKFVDPELESLSAGHKLMLRVGNDNAARIKKKLREIRGELVKAAQETQEKSKSKSK